MAKRMKMNAYAVTLKKKVESVLAFILKITTGRKEIGESACAVDALVTFALEVCLVKTVTDIFFRSFNTSSIQFILTRLVMCVCFWTFVKSH